MITNSFQLSPVTRYALCGMAYIARRPARSFALIDQIAAAERLPRHFLAKIFQQLAQRGFLTARRGPGGGYALAQDPEKILLSQVMSALENSPASKACFLANRNCNPERPCPLHHAVVRAGAVLDEAFEAMTLADLRDLR